MGILQNVALVILGISLFVFIGLFGRLPAFRKTPIGFLHRTLTIHLPNGFAFVDAGLFGGRLMKVLTRLGSYILHDNHPLILIFFLSLLSIGQFIFIPTAWPRISSTHQFWVPAVVILPYFLLYKCVVTKSFITRENHDQEMERYPFDRILFHPGRHCDTCDFPKPARSKHCSFCRACVSRHDHHCVWLMNCVGAQNYVYFLTLLLSMSVLLIYGTILGYSLLFQTLEEEIPSNLDLKLQTWSTYFNIWGIVISSDPRIGSVTLLMLMTAPLAVAFLVYHTYLIWAGMTTNESAKWSDWKEDVLDGFVYKANRHQIDGPPPYCDLSDRPWPVQSDQVLITDEDPPMEGYIFARQSNHIFYERDGEAEIDPLWTRLHSMKDVDNIYDIGVWNNFKEALGLNVREKSQRY